MAEDGGGVFQGSKESRGRLAEEWTKRPSVDWLRRVCVWSFSDLEEAEERKQRKKGGLVGRGVNKRTRREEGVRQSQRVKTGESLRKQMEGEGQWAKV